MDISTNRLLYLAYYGFAYLTHEYQRRAFAAQRVGDALATRHNFDLANDAFCAQQALFDLIHGDPAITDTTTDNGDLAEFLREE